MTSKHKIGDNIFHNHEKDGQKSVPGSRPKLAGAFHHFVTLGCWNEFCVSLYLCTTYGFEINVWLFFTIIFWIGFCFLALELSTLVQDLNFLSAYFNWHAIDWNLLCSELIATIFTDEKKFKAYWSDIS